MTILEAIHRIDAVKPNGYSQSDKIKWLSTLDGTIRTEIIDTHEGGDNVVFEGYNDNTELNTALLVPAPYDEVYIRWLEARIDYYNGEYNKYNNSASAYNTAYMDYARYYNEKHTPLHKHKRFIF